MLKLGNEPPTARSQDHIAEVTVALRRGGQGAVGSA